MGIPEYSTVINNEKIKGTCKSNNENNVHFKYQYIEKSKMKQILTLITYFI